MITFKTFLIVVLAMVIFISNASAQSECGKLSKQKVSAAEARIMMYDLKLVDPDVRWIDYRDDCSELCGNKDVLVWGNDQSTSRGMVYTAISICKNLPAEKRLGARIQYLDGLDAKFMWVKD